MAESAEASYLVTGANGQAGRAVCRVLYDREKDCLLARPRETFDVTDLERVRSRLTLLKPAAVFNCAAYTRVRQAEQQAELCWRTNALAVDNLGRCLAPERIPLIHLSTDFVFGQDRDRRQPYLEEDAAGPLGQYGLSKYAGEAGLLKWMQLYPDWPCFIVRVAGVFELPRRHRQNFPQQLVQLLDKLHPEPLPVVDDVHSSFTLAEDLADALVWLADRARDTPPGIYHLSNGGHGSWYEFAQHFLRVKPRRRGVTPMPLAEYARRQGFDATARQRYTVLDTRKFHELGYGCLPPWQEAVERWVRHYRR